MTNFRLFQTERLFADDNFEFNENGRKLSKWVENNVAISPFLTVFSKDLNRRHIKTRVCLGKA